MRREDNARRCCARIVAHALGRASRGAQKDIHACRGLHKQRTTRQSVTSLACSLASFDVRRKQSLTFTVPSPSLSSERAAVQQGWDKTSIASFFGATKCRQGAKSTDGRLPQTPIRMGPPLSMTTPLAILTLRPPSVSSWLLFVWETHARQKQIGPDRATKK